MRILHGVSLILLMLIGTASAFIVQNPIRNVSVNELYTQIIGEIASLNKEFVNIENTLAGIKVNSANLTTAFDKVTKRYNGVEKELEEVDTVDTKREGKVTNVTNQFNSLKRDYTDIVKNVSIIEQQLTSLGQQQAQLSEEISKLNTTKHTDQSSTPANQTQNDKRRVGFSVTKPEQRTTGRNGALLFNSSIYNDDGLFNFSSRQFECRKSGLYFFSATIIREPGGYPESYCYLMINGHARAYLGAYSFRGSYGQPSGTATILYHMDIGDTAYVGMCGILMQISKDSTFNGFLIYED